MDKTVRRIVPTRKLSTTKLKGGKFSIILRISTYFFDGWFLRNEHSKPRWTQCLLLVSVRFPPCTGQPSTRPESFNRSLENGEGTQLGDVKKTVLLVLWEKTNILEKYLFVSKSFLLCFIFHSREFFQFEIFTYIICIG